MKKLIAGIAVAVAMLVGPRWAMAGNYTWQLPGGFGNVSLPLTVGNTLIAGYDVVLKTPIEGASTQVGSFFPGTKEQIDANLGAVNAWGVAGSPVQPFISLSHDVKNNIPALAKLTDLQLHLFARYDTNLGKLGGGIAAGYTPSVLNPASTTTACAPQLEPKLSLLVVNPRV